MIAGLVSMVSTSWRAGELTKQETAVRYAYPFVLEPEEDGTAVNVSFPDVPSALTFGADEAEDCLIAALGGYVKAREPIPAQSAARGRPARRPAAAGRGQAGALRGAPRVRAEQRRPGRAARGHGVDRPAPARPRPPLAHRAGGCGAPGTRQAPHHRGAECGLKLRQVRAGLRIDCCCFIRLSEPGSILILGFAAST